MSKFDISPGVEKKLRDKHQVEPKEVLQCFENCDGQYLIDTREDHKTDPQTMWFVAETNKRRLLKVCFMQIDGVVTIKTAYDANSDEIRIYKKFAY